MRTTVKVLLALVVVILAFNSCNDNPYKQGEAIYNNVCASCHMVDGSGLEQQIPALAGADYLEENNLYTACIIRYGISDTILVNGVTYNQPMEGNRELSEFQITNVMNYINHAWGNDLGIVKLEDVRKQLEGCQK
ncbi:MAG: cytochrome c [Bacteroidota bacterium]